MMKRFISLSTRRFCSSSSFVKAHLVVDDFPYVNAKKPVGVVDKYYQDLKQIAMYRKNKVSAAKNSFENVKSEEDIDLTSGIVVSKTIAEIQQNRYKYSKLLAILSKNKVLYKKMIFASTEAKKVEEDNFEFTETELAYILGFIAEAQSASDLFALDGDIIKLINKLLSKEFFEFSLLLLNKLVELHDSLLFQSSDENLNKTVIKSKITEIFSQFRDTILTQDHFLFLTTATKLKIALTTEEKEKLRDSFTSISCQNKRLVYLICLGKHNLLDKHTNFKLKNLDLSTDELAILHNHGFTANTPYNLIKTGDTPGCNIEALFDLLYKAADAIGDCRQKRVIMSVGSMRNNFSFEAIELIKRIKDSPDFQLSRLLRFFLFFKYGMERSILLKQYFPQEEDWSKADHELVKYVLKKAHSELISVFSYDYDIFNMNKILNKYKFNFIETKSIVEHILNSFIELYQTRGETADLEVVILCLKYKLSFSISLPDLDSSEGEIPMSLLCSEKTMSQAKNSSFLGNYLHIIDYLSHKSEDGSKLATAVFTAVADATAKDTLHYYILKHYSAYVTFPRDQAVLRLLRATLMASSKYEFDLNSLVDLKRAVFLSNILCRHLIPVPNMQSLKGKLTKFIEDSRFLTHLRDLELSRFSSEMLTPTVISRIAHQVSTMDIKDKNNYCPLLNPKTVEALLIEIISKKREVGAYSFTYLAAQIFDSFTDYNLMLYMATLRNVNSTEFDPEFTLKLQSKFGSYAYLDELRQNNKNLLLDIIYNWPAFIEHSKMKYILLDLEDEHFAHASLPKLFKASVQHRVLLWKTIIKLVNSPKIEALIEEDPELLLFFSKAVLLFKLKTNTNTPQKVVDLILKDPKKNKDCLLYLMAYGNSSLASNFREHNDRLKKAYLKEFQGVKTVFTDSSVETYPKIKSHNKEFAKRVVKYYVDSKSTESHQDLVEQKDFQNLKYDLISGLGTRISPEKAELQLVKAVVEFQLNQRNLREIDDNLIELSKSYINQDQYEEFFMHVKKVALNSNRVINTGEVLESGIFVDFKLANRYSTTLIKLIPRELGFDSNRAKGNISGIRKILEELFKKEKILLVNPEDNLSRLIKE